MTRILAVADPHIGATHLTTLDEQERALDEVREIAARERAEILLIGGDLFHHNRPNPEAIGVVGRFFDQLNIPVVMAKGNHDPDAAEIARYFRGGQVWVWVPKEAEAVRHPTGIDIGILPYLPDRFVRAAAGGNATKEEVAHLLTNAAREILLGFLARRREGVPLVLVAHGTVAGTSTSTGWQMGFLPGTEWLIPLEEAQRFDLVIAGHIHRHQAPAPNVVVPGSLLPLDFAETEAHGVVIADLGPMGAFHTGGSWSFIPLSSAPTVATLEWDDRELERAMTAPMVFARGGRAPDKLRVRVRCREENARRFPTPAIVAQLQRAGAKYVQVDLEVVRGDRARDERVTSEVAPPDALGFYLREQDDLSQEQREQVEAKGIEAYRALREEASVTGGGDLELRAIEAQDFLGVHDARIQFDGHGVYAITGAVGAGKSAIGCDAVRFALYGASRYGAKVTDQLVRQGADVALASVELERPDGGRYRIVRKLKRTSRGVMSTLDVLEFHDTGEDGGWLPKSSGKVAGGQQVVDELLGGLTDDTLVASSLVIQRAADAFTRARPEQRKALLAEAAGLSVYDRLTEISRGHLQEAERTLARQHALAEPLRPRAAAAAELEVAIAVATDAVVAGKVKVEQAQRKRDDLVEQLAAAAATLARHDDAQSRVDELARAGTSINEELLEWDRKKAVADRILTDRSKYEGAKAALEEVRAQIRILESDQEKERAQQTAHDTAVAAVSEKERRLERVRAERIRERDVVAREIEHAERSERQLRASACPVIDQITAKTLAACVFLTDASADVAKLDDLGKRLGTLEEPGADEAALVDQIYRFEVPEAPQDAETTIRVLRFARQRAQQLEADVQVGEKIARAEAVVEEHASATAKLRERLAATNHELLGAHERVRARAAAVSEVVRLGEQKTIAGGFLQAAQRELADAERDVAFTQGRLEEARRAQAELADVDRAITAVAADVAAWKKLVDAWRACRVLVLESSVIPAVENTANEILRRFPYGMQLAFSTQREKRSGDGVSEALDIEVLGGRAPVYEGCSGGQKTTIDFALHVAIALVVSRRSSSRLRFLFADEPEGLDEPGRAAFAAIARWIHEAFSLTVLVASHAADLVDALGGQRIEITAGVDGSTVVIA